MQGLGNPGWEEWYGKLIWKAGQEKKSGAVITLTTVFPYLLGRTSLMKVAA